MKAGPPAKLDVQDLRRRIRQADAALAERFWGGDDVTGLLGERARFIDAFLAEIWQHWFPHDADLALFAVGGYGRGELHPHSDIDLLILVRKPAGVKEEIAAFVRLLWDLRLDIGHSVRTLADCRREAAQDISVATTMLERRRLAGSARLAAKLDKLLAKRTFWPSRRFFHAKRQEQNERHAQFNDVDYDLEPNIKSSPGGLRDIQTVLWITQRHLGGTRDRAEGEAPGRQLAELEDGGFLTRLECQWLLDGRRFLWRVRFGLHIVAGRREDRLLFDHQRELAKRFGNRDSDGQLAVERFMHDYYRHVLLLREVNDILLQHFEEAILGAGARKKPRIEPINARFRIHNDYIEAASDGVFAAHPPALMEMFVLMANRRDIAGVRAATIRLVREHLHLIDDDFRRDAQVCASFLALLRAPYTLVSQLTRMRRYGILGRYIPEFGRVVGQMQHDLFHIYTVDAHTMMVLRQMRRFLQPAAQERFPLAARVVRRLPKIELLYIAGLFHDIGKGRGGDHSDLGAEDAALFCQRHGLDADHCALVAWLVREHLTMSATAQRKDIADPDVVNEFARLVENETRLDYLCALTVADINATNPTLWNSWRETLMGQLYEGTRQALQRGLDTPAERGAKAQACRDAALLELAGGIGEKRALDIWQGADDGFFLHHSAAQVAVITRAIDGHDLRPRPAGDAARTRRQRARFLERRRRHRSVPVRRRPRQSVRGQRGRPRRRRAARRRGARFHRRFRQVLQRLRGCSPATASGSPWARTGSAWQAAWPRPSRPAAALQDARRGASRGSSSTSCCRPTCVWTRPSAPAPRPCAWKPPTAPGCWRRSAACSWNCASTSTAPASRPLANASKTSSRSPTAAAEPSPTAATRRPSPRPSAAVSTNRSPCRRPESRAFTDAHRESAPRPPAGVSLRAPERAARRLDAESAPCAHVALHRRAEARRAGLRGGGARRSRRTAARPRRLSANPRQRRAAHRDRRVAAAALRRRRGRRHRGAAGERHPGGALLLRPGGAQRPPRQPRADAQSVLPNLRGRGAPARRDAALRGGDAHAGFRERAGRGVAQCRTGVRLQSGQSERRSA